MKRCAARGFVTIISPENWVVQLFENLVEAGYLVERDEDVLLTDSGETFVTEFGIDLSALTKKPPSPV